MKKVGLDYIHSPEKRRLDILGSAALMSLAAPATIAIGTATAIEHKRLNPLFVQQRIGRAGKPFRNYKLQSLRVRNAEQQLIGGHSHPDASRVGRLIRKSCLDELPQLTNVIKGDISLVGIRPTTQNFLEYYEMIAQGSLFDEWYAWYLENPGLTGVGQLASNMHGIYTPDVLRRRMEMDIHGSENASLRSDLQLIGKTPVVLFLRTLGFKR